MLELSVFQRSFSAFFPEIEARFEESLAKHTSFRIGGNAEVMAFPKSVEELSALLKKSALLDWKFAILGAGTNVLAPDEGVRGLVICLKDCLDGMEQIDSTRIRIMAGVTMSRAAVFAANLGLSGLEFAHGIPGTVGGGVFMNAGAYGGEIADVCESVEVMDYSGRVQSLSRDQMDFSYRHSRLEEEKAVVVSATFQLAPQNPDAIRAKMKEYQQRRLAAQPLDLPSAGSAFKRPTGGYAAALIDEAGLKGYRVGGAGISEKHAGFAVNLGGATAADVKALLHQVSETVYAATGIRLEPEIRIW